jgi:hypothetical protein
MDAVPKLCDARGKKSKTLFFVAVSWAVLTMKFIVAGVDLGPLGVQSVITATEFGMAFAAILAVWVGREYGEKGVFGPRALSVPHQYGAPARRPPRGHGS